MKKVISKDGTPIAYEASGTGPALLLVHGGASSPDRWKLVSPRFEPSFTVYRVARRGVDGSGDATNYSVARQAEDIATVVDAIGGPVNVLGHSFGGLCALEGALLTANIHRLILYEPPVVPVLPPGFADRLQALLDAGDRDGVWTTMNREIVKMPEHEIEMLRAQPVYASKLAGIHTLVQEVRVLEHYKFDPQRFGAVSIPTLLLVGGASPAWANRATQAIHAAVPTSQVVVLPGQQHVAMDAAPDLFVQEVTTFLTR